MSGVKSIGGVKIDCTHFKGYKPCKPHKKYGVHCEGCNHYAPTEKKILIIKLAAAGEVIRNTPLLRRIKKEYPNSQIFWLTEYPDLIPADEVYGVYDFRQKRTVELFKDMEFDILYALDKHEEVGALANGIRAKVKKGFSQIDGTIVPFDDDAMKKWKMGVFDDLMKANTKHYVEEIFEICGFKYEGEKYILPKFKVPKVDLDTNKTVVALNTGISNQWKPRAYSEESWINLANMLSNRGYEVMFVGGPEEDEKNKRLAGGSAAKYFGHFSYPEFIGLMSLSDIVVTPVTFALHIAIGLDKNVVLLNNIFNKKEFHLFGKGTILEPNIPCLMCYKADFDDECYIRKNNIPDGCMDLITPQRITDEVLKLKAPVNNLIKEYAS